MSSSLSLLLVPHPLQLFFFRFLVRGGRSGRGCSASGRSWMETGSSWMSAFKSPDQPDPPRPFHSIHFILNRHIQLTLDLIHFNLIHSCRSFNSI